MPSTALTLVQEVTFEGALSRWLLPSGSRATITRVDETLSWYVDRKRKRQVPALGLPDAGAGDGVAEAERLDRAARVSDP